MIPGRAKNWPAEEGEIETINGRPALELPGDGLLIGDFAERLGRLLREAGIFARKGCAFTANADGQQLEPVTPGCLRTWIEEHVVPYKSARAGKTGQEIRIVKSLSEDTARAVLVSPQFLSQLPSVERFNPCPMPVLRDDGTIELSPVGLDLAAKIYTADPGFGLVVVPVEEAAKALRDFLSEFAWPNDGGRGMAVHVSAMLSVFAAAVLPPGTVKPAFLYLANAEGAGKTLLASLAGMPYRDIPAEAAPRTDEEWQKKLLAATIAGRRLVLIDNAKGHLDSAALEAYITCAVFGGRILGVSKEFHGEAGATVLLTGNRLTISADLQRRVLMVELFMSELRAADRKFRRVLDAQTIREARPRIVSAMWSIVSAWDKAGRPESSIINSSFPRWSASIGGMVEFAGFGSPLAPAEIEGMGDTDTADFAALAARLKTGEQYTFEDLVAAADEGGLFERITNDRDHEGNLRAGAKSKFGKILTRYKDRRVSPDEVFAVEGRGRSRRYLICTGSTGCRGVSAIGENNDFPIGPDHLCNLYDLCKPEDISTEKDPNGDPF
jgi:hypothetical protein